MTGSHSRPLKFIYPSKKPLNLAGKSDPPERHKQNPAWPVREKVLCASLEKPVLLAESADRASVRFGSFHLTILGGSGGHKRSEQCRGCTSDFIDRTIEGLSVRNRRRGRSADLSYKLNGRHPDFIVGGGRLEIEQHLDIPAHAVHLQLCFKLSDRYMESSIDLILANGFSTSFPPCFLLSYALDSNPHLLTSSSRSLRRFMVFDLNCGW
jgi:hypothetical protein